MLVIKRAGKHFFEKKRFLAPLPVDYIIRNKYSYPGGSYGEYGGYDLVLIRLKDPVSSKGQELEPIYLPENEHFNDIVRQFVGTSSNAKSNC